MSKVKAIKNITEDFLKLCAEERQELRDMAEEAEASDDYYDYDQACYDSFERMFDAGENFAKQVLELINLKEKK